MMKMTTLNSMALFAFWTTSVTDLIHPQSVTLTVDELPQQAVWPTYDVSREGEVLVWCGTHDIIEDADLLVAPEPE